MAFHKKVHKFPTENNDQFGLYAETNHQLDAGVFLSDHLTKWGTENEQQNVTRVDFDY